MTDVRSATDTLLSEKPALEEPLRGVVAVDEANDTWTFDDVPLDSGAFGELVSRGIVKEADGEYALTDREAVRRALDGGSNDSTSDEPSTSVLDSVPSVEIDRVAAAGLVGALALLILFRLIPIASVFRGGDVVLSANDPYAYRYLVHELLTRSSNPFDLSVLSSLSARVEHGEPLMVVTLWWVSALFGGESAVGGVLAWFPVVSAIVTGLLVYALTVRVTEDKRAGIAAVALLAVTPAHAFRTGLGFADHHAFDYPWLALTALAVVALAGRDIRERRTWTWVGILGTGVAGQMLAWEAGPLLLAPIGLYAMAMVPSWLRDGQSPLVAGVPLLAGVVLGTLVAVGVHLGLGWHTPAVIVGPVLLSVGIAALLAVGEGAHRGGFGGRSIAVVEIVGALVGVAVLRSLVPAFATELERGVEFLLTTEGIAETTSIVSGDLGTFVGPLFLFGFVLFLALGHMGWAVWTSYRRHAPAWLAVGLYAWYFLLLSAIQVRFAGQLALFAALFGGLGFVHLAAWVDLTSAPSPFKTPEESVEVSSEPSDYNRLEWPERRKALYAGALGLGVGSLGGLLTPIRHSQLTIDDSMYEAAKFMQEYSAKRGWEYPENYVFSQWGDNRFYNWFVNRESQSYGYAQGNFEDFVTSTDGQEWYERLRNRAGFVVIEDELSINGDSQTIYEQLWTGFGLATSHYRAVWTAENDSRRVYTLVPGVRVTGRVSESGSVTVEGECEINGESRSVSMECSVSESGIYDVTLPLPGAYTIDENTVNVSEKDVLRGMFRSSFEGEGTAYWSFDEGSGDVAYDRVGGRHATITNGQWVEGIEGSAISFDGEGYGEAHPMEGSTEEFTVSAWIKPETVRSGAILSTGKDGWAGGHTGILFDHGLSGWNDDRLGMYLGNGDSSRVFTSQNLGIKYPADEYRHVAVVFDQGTVRWYLDEEMVGRNTTDMQQVVHSRDKATYIGREFSGKGGRNNFDGDIDELRYYETALDGKAIADLASKK